jgi:hypothetical protein
VRLKGEALLMMMMWFVAAAAAALGIGVMYG